MLQIERINDALRLGVLDLRLFNEIAGIGKKRDLEKEGTRFLLEKLFSKPVSLCYTPENKPYLPDENCELSISHSHNKLAIIVNEKQSAGVDVELIRDKVRAIRHKFLSEAERSFAGEDVESLITLWAAKEAIFKAWGKKELDFIANIRIAPFGAPDQNLKGELMLPGIKKTYTLQRRKIEDYMLVFILDEI